MKNKMSRKKKKRNVQTQPGHGMAHDSVPGKQVKPASGQSRSAFHVLQEKGPLYLAWTGLAFSLFAFCSYWYVVFKYAVDAPYYDDYGAVLGSLNNFLSKPGLLSRLHVLFSQHNEHRIVFDRVVELVDYYIFSRINFIHMIVVGDIGLVLMTALVLVYLIKRRVRPLNVAIVVVTMFTLCQYELMTYAMTSIQQYYGLFFSLTAIFFFTDSDSVADFIAGLCFATAASFTSGGGLIVFPVMLLYFAFSKDRKRLLVVSLYGVLVFYVYFILLHYQSTPINTASRIYAFHHPLAYIHYILLFIGNLSPRPAGIALYLPLVAGIILLLLAVHISVLYWSRRKEPFLFFSILFICATAAAAGLSRISLGVGEAVASRYSINSSMLLVLVISYYVIAYKENMSVFLFLNIAGLVLPVSLCIWWLNAGTADSYFRPLQFISPHYVICPPDPTQCLGIIAESRRLGIFTPDHVMIPAAFQRGLVNTPLPTSVNQIASLPRKDSAIDFCIGSINNYRLSCKMPDGEIVLESDKLRVSGWAVDEDAHGMATAVYGDVDGILFPLTYGVATPAVAAKFNNPDYASCGFLGNETIHNLRHGGNVLSFRVINNRATGYYQTPPILLYVNPKDAKPHHRAPLP